MSIEPVAVKAVLQSMLDLHLQRAELASRNIAGAATPGFVAGRVDSEAFLASVREAVRNPACDSGCLPDAQALSSEAQGLPSLDASVAEMVAASGDYQSVMQALNGHLGLMRLAISGRPTA